MEVWGSYKNSLIEFLTLWECVDNFAVYVFNLDHLVSFFVAIGISGILY